MIVASLSIGESCHEGGNKSIADPADNMVFSSGPYLSSDMILT